MDRAGAVRPPSFPRRGRRKFAADRPAQTRLEALVDAWEGLIGEEDAEEEVGALERFAPPLERLGPPLERLGNARAGAVAALARTLDCPADPNAVATLARRWTMPDAAQSVAVRLPRALRPLLILANAPPSGAGLGALLRTVRLGMFGR